MRQLAAVATFLLAAVAVVVWWSVANDHVSVVVSSVMTACLLGIGATTWLLVRNSTAQLGKEHAECNRLRLQLERLRVDSAEVRRMQGRFVGHIAHEIKTPLATAVGHAELLLRTHDDPDASRAHAECIVEDMRHLADLVDSFLRLAHPFAHDDADDTSHHLPVHVHDSVLVAVRRCRAHAQHRDVAIVPTLRELEDELEVLGDPLLLETMVENLVRNAVRHSPRHSDVEILVEADADWITIRVRDHGPGITIEDPEAMFDWFFAAPNVAGRPAGTGFGLAIARRIAVHHGGTLRGRNHVAGGCEFSLRLPRLRDGGTSVSSVVRSSLSPTEPVNS